MNAGHWGRGVVILGLVLAGATALADKDKGGRGESREWRDYYQEREDREAHNRRESSQQEREWREYNRERQRRGYRSAPAPTGPQADIRIGGYFGYPQRVEIYNYYHERARRGFCPPGLAKKDNGCMPPGQQRAWAIGRPLPPDVVYYPVEPAVQVRLGVPPPGHEFIRVASDILLIAVGTGMVIDAIGDLGR